MARPDIEPPTGCQPHLTQNAPQYIRTLANDSGGKERIVDHYEHTCVENNGSFGQVAVAQKN